MTRHNDSTTPADADGTPIEVGDRVVPIGDPGGQAGLVVGFDGPDVVADFHGERTRRRGRLLRVVTVRDAHGARLNPGDIVRPLVDDGRSMGRYVLCGIVHTGNLVTVHVGQTAPMVTIPAMLVRVGIGFEVGDAVYDLDGVHGVVMSVAEGVARVETIGGGRVLRHVAALRHAGDGDGGADEPLGAMDLRAWLDVQLILRDDAVPGQRDSG